MSTPLGASAATEGDKRQEEPGVKVENETKKSVMAAVKSIKRGKSGKNIPPLKKIHKFIFYE